MIYGRATDPQGAVVPNVRVTVTNVDTNTTVEAITNESGYYEANLLIHGNYQVSFEAAGFRRLVRRGIVLPMSSRVEVSARLELGPVAESVTVEAAAPLIDAISASSGRVLDNRTQQALPTSFNNVTILARFTPGVQTTGEVRILDANDQGSSSDYRIAGSVGGNEWAVDGAPNMGTARLVGFLPHTDVVAEMKVETGGFEASLGHTTGAVVSLVSKAGTNDYHGSASFQHIQNRWNAANFFTAQLWHRQIAAAEARGDLDLARRLRGTPKQPGGLKNYWAGTLGGPVILPGLFNGKDRLFFFFSYYGKRWSETTSSQYLNHTFPTMADREGNFAPHLLVDAVRYQIHDPLSVRPDPARPTHYLRDPLPGNILPKSRINNPAYSFFVKTIPPPNNNPADPKKEPLNNWLGVSMPWTADYIAVTNRIDFHHSPRNRFYGRWLWDNYDFDRGDYAFETMPGLMNSRAIRDNFNFIADWVYTPNAATLLDFSVSMHRYRTSGNLPSGLVKYKPSDVGLPTYMDQKAGAAAMLPYMATAGYRRAIGGTGFGLAAGTVEHYRQSSVKADVSHIRSRHSIRGGADARLHSRAGGGGGYPAGYFSFDNFFTRRNSDTLTPAGAIAHSWAAFMMGLPSGMSVSTNDTYYMSSPYAGWYVQDSWRLTPSLTVNYGLRLEYERGPRERFDRMLAWFDPSQKLPISDAAQAAYAARPLAERPASDFLVRGGTIYAGKDTTRNWWESELMWLPRLGAAWQVAPKTVIRGAYGLFFDTLNAMLSAPNQTGFSRTTSTVLTTDFGYTWLVGNPRAGVSPMADPFPVRTDGTRFDTPLRDALGSMALAGRSFSYYDSKRRHARQQRWRLGVQRQLGQTIVVEAAYAGSSSDRNYLGRPLNPLPEKYWADGLVRNNAIASDLSRNLSNPFTLSNFTALQRSLPLVYQDMSTLGFFRSATIAKAQLLRPYPHMGTLTWNGNEGEVRTDELQLSFERRFADGFNLHVAYTRLHDREADYFHNEFDALPSWRDSNDSRPHRLAATSLFELPFGKNKPLASSGIAAALLGGFQISLTYEFQSGALLDFGNLFYYGDLKNIPLDNKTFSRWFNTADFERNASRAPASYHRRVFPTRVPDVRADWTNHWNGSLQREIRLLERFRLQFRVDVLNVANRTQMAAPVTNPLATNFAECTQQAWTTKRFLQFQLRLQF